MAGGHERVDREPPFKRFGLGFQYRPPEAPVVMTFGSVSEKRGEVRAELHVEKADGGHVLRRYLNLLGSTSLKDLVRDLTEVGGGYPWSTILEAATESIIRAIRVGPELETYGGAMDRPPGICWLCKGLVMAGVPNVWIAAASTGKSTFAAALCVCHAVGAPFLDRETTRGVPLYLDWESDADDFREKIWLVSRWLGLREVPTVHRLAMRGPAIQSAAAIANRIDQLGATLVVWDGIQAAGGPVGQYTTYESVAMDLEAVLGLLPRTTHLLLDHVTGDEMKVDAIPRKGRGGSRKVEWTRNQWTLVLDRDAHQARRHVAGWTHTKINRAEYLPSFGVEVLHRPDELGFKVVEESEVAPLKEKMPSWRQLLAVAQEAGRPLMNREAADLWKGNKDRRNVDLVRALVNQHPRAFTRNEDGSFQPHWTLIRAGAMGTAAANGTGAPERRPEYEDVEEPSELPF
jgi:hypothetical protein